LVSTAWRHSIEGHAINIRNSVYLIRQRLNIGVDIEYIIRGLEIIENQAQKIIEKPITPPLSSEEGVEIVSINDLLRERVSQLRENEPYSHVNVTFKLDPDNKILVRASPQWLTRAVDILIDNSIHAMSDSEQKNISISTSVTHDEVVIYIEDTGRGIPKELLPTLFAEPISKEDGKKGLGVGLLIAKMIFQAYKGDIVLERTDTNGSVFKISFPQAIK
jgi:signal transduction histidine kinase